ncbi:hypothetical protein C8R44DRAFT_992144 [Mycena epipterygia]|nr:hypothetical protein C8R44DRAFT_992144 [Mycena epipterygia]
MSRRLKARSDFYRAVHDPSLPIDVFINKVKNARKILKGLGCEPGEVETTDVLLINLHPSWAGVRTSITSNKDEQKFDDVVGILNGSTVTPPVKEEADDAPSDLAMAATTARFVALERALPTVGNLQETPSFVASTCFKVWDDFVTLAQERLQVLRRFRTEGYISRGACDNIECGVIKERREFKRCSGCRDHLYCSRHCQTVAWKKQPEGHRATCNARRQLANLNFDSRPLGETKRDHLFRLFLLQSDYRRLKLTILLQKLAHIHKTTDTNFCTVFAYGSTSCITRVDPAEKWGHLVPTTEPRIALSSGRMELHLVLTDGANCSPILFRSSTSELTDGLVRIAGKIPPGTDISELHVRFPQLFEEVQRLSDLRVVETHG